ncbi:nickel pincer cofactor biosynthesis protein LarC [Haloarcula sp. S1AR25-5A]|uniref:Putative nickel insertion protein n=1 Tax=Haloarcula terrestris TaxID=2950533 RepID=A0AAE4EVU1_9EURY|nr:nickel pincer cofactor biosynthesis protein LarC [Haloarcula terrestris]MDS0220973.1 nickel pincer cofactor biosynthesis protein LarC [Haloarcula terrestris]
MRTLAFDGRMGAAGDMLLGALLAAGADRDALSPVEDELPIEYAVSEVDRCGIAAARVEVLLTDADSDGNGFHDHAHDDGHSHEHTHDEHSHSHSHTHDGDDNDHTRDHDGDDHDHTHAEGHGPSRTYAEVVDLVEEMGLPKTVKADALAMFEILGEAEASVHGTDLDGTHFHEVGADDAIADIVGACLLLDDLDVDRVVTTPLSTGGGTVEMSHGTYPVPTPAVVEIAERADWSLQGGPIDRELVTPTGAAIFAHIAEGTESLPPLKVDTSGYGAGGWNLDDRPNVLRALVGDGAGRLRRDEITVLETNVDDVSPEVLGDLQRTLADVGARDVSIVPTTMKKSRPGHIVKVICKPEDAERIARRLAEATGTLGVRESGAGHRWVADREYETVALSVDGEQFEVTVKVASDTDGTVFDVSAEYDDAAAVADQTGLSVREIQQRAERMVRE